MTDKANKIRFLRNEGRGDHIPRDFASAFDDRNERVRGVSDDEWSVLEAGPGCPEYLATWNDVCRTARIMDGNDVVYRIRQDKDGDVWLIPSEMEWCDQAGDWVWPETTEVK